MKLEIPELNPIFRREVLAYLRSPWIRVALLLYMTAPFAVVTWEWPSGQLDLASFHGGSATAQKLVESYFVCEALLLVFAVCVMGSFAVAGERANRTYDSLLTTRIARWSVGASKLAAVLVAGFGLFLASLPALSIVFYMGGVDAAFILRDAFLILSLSLLSGTVSLYCSSVIGRTHLALLASLGVMVAYLVAGSLMAAVAVRISPYSLETTQAILSLLLFLVMLWAMIRGTSRSLEDGPVRKRRAPPPPAGWWGEFWRGFLEAGSPSEFKPPVPDRANPIAFIERSNARIQKRQGNGTLGMTIMLLLLLSVSWAWVHGRGAPIVPVAFVLVLAAITLVHAATFVGDWEDRTLEALKLSGITWREYLRGKLSGCWEAQAGLGGMVLFLAFIHWTLIWEPGAGFGRLVWALLLEIWVGLVMMELAAVTATFLALRTRAVMRTLMWTAMAVVIAYGIPSACLHLILSRLLTTTGELAVMALWLTTLLILGVWIVRVQLRHTWDGEEE